MSMSHKAFVFDFAGFRRELAPLLAASLADGETKPLIEFADRHVDTLRHPYEGFQLAAGWTGQVQVDDVQEVADFVLTRYYDPIDDGGLGETWLSIESTLDDEQRSALLGQTFGPAEELFDPGRLGSYFQDEAQVRRSLDVIRALNRQDLSEFSSTLERANRNGQGTYVTF